ncbi:FemAB family XrtA/PEP-CTERM system-associated protein [Erythrobacter sp.]|jgi:FemAB-related protein (PEP-CTERM system-associated)|uniref:FemAB family XrtA/PEP-CTERM system-associated protein n=1 Tax=Erythrobacter sp. TaxID=1042 RepID=UPI002EA9A6A5|nr:FemAB family XrtA/PEP-CTERM system-associated protein [Erythrobacter sp.]
MNAPVRLETSVHFTTLRDSAERSAIEGFVRECEASLFHLPQWLTAVEAGTGQRASGFVASRGGTIAGWLPIIEVRSRLFGRALVSSGFGVGGGICAVDEGVAAALAQAAQSHAVRDNFASIECRGGPVPEGWEAVADKHCGFAKELAEDDEAQLLASPRKARAEIRKALKDESLSVRTGREADDLAAHYAVYSESVRNLGTPVFPRRLFAEMLRAFPEASDILTVERHGKPIASVFSFYHRGAVMPFWGGGTLAARGARANELMYYRLMLHARRRGMTRFDFGRSKIKSGPYRFKKNWGFEPQPLTYAHWHAPGETPRDVDPTSPAYARRIALWKRLPLFIANRIGPPIARGLA